jgi:hypothetical protein
MSTVLERDLPEVKAVQVRGTHDVATVINALEHAQAEVDDVSTDGEALVELAESYTGWSP